MKSPNVEMKSTPTSNAFTSEMNDRVKSLIEVFSPTPGFHSPSNRSSAVNNNLP